VKKIAQNVAQAILVIKPTDNLNRGKVAKKIWAFFKKKLHKLNTKPSGENSSNQVTLFGKYQAMCTIVVYATERWLSRLGWSVW
jgi:hypothetical protein